jgi:SAM-dependent methyltransferase
MIDLGAGSGRDAAWFAAKGFQVLAVEPAAGMRAEGQRRHGALPIQWLDDRLPALAATIKLGVAADIVNLGAVWMHLASEEDRRPAFRKVVSLTRSGGVILISLRKKPFDDVRTFKSTTVYDIECLARGHGLVVARVACVRDGMGRGDVSWDCIALRLPHDGTDALPLLRHVILNDSKSTTYKLALLRSLCRAAESAAGMARGGGRSRRRSSRSCRAFLDAPLRPAACSEPAPKPKKRTAGKSA